MKVRIELEHLVRAALDDNPRDALIAVRRLADDQIPWLEQRAVRNARRDGWSWARIARLLQTSRQTAYRRFRHLDDAAPRVPRIPMSDGELVERDIIEIDRRRRQKEELRAWEASGDDLVPW